MLQIPPQNGDLIQEEGRSSGDALAEIASFLRRRRAIIGAFIGLGILLGLAYTFLSTPTYTALSELVIDAHKSSGQPQTILGDPISDSAIVESQVEVLRSEGIARTVIKQLNLTQDTEFNGESPSAVGRFVQSVTSSVHRIFGARETSASDSELAAALIAFGRRLDVRRVGLGFVLEIRFRSRDPVKAARIANAVVSAYMTEALTAKIQGSDKLDHWLQERMVELRKKLTGSLIELQKFKAEHDLVDSNQGALENIAQLRDLEAVAHGYQAIYESFVQSYAETLRTSFPSLEARVITTAIPPTKKSWPRGSIILPLALCLGTLIGLPIAFWRDRSDRKLRSPSHVRDALGLRCLGLLPKHAQARPGKAAADPAIWSAKAVVDVRGLSRPAKVIGVTSALPHEGKTTVATMLAMLSTRTGTKTLVIDACLENPTLTDRFAPHAKAGFLDLPAGHVSPEKTVVMHKPSGLHMLPATAKDRGDRDPGITSRSMQDVLEWARREYDFVIVDLPAISASVDVWASTSLVDGLILVVEWGVTDQATVAEALGSLDLTDDQLVGVLLNKADAVARPTLRRKGLDRYLNRDRTVAAERFVRELRARFGWRDSRARSAPISDRESAGGTP